MMLLRYTQLKGFIDSQDLELAELLPTAAENLRIETLVSCIKKVESVTKKLQDDDLNLHEVRVLFDALIKEFPEMKPRLAYNAAIVHSNVFETAIVKTIDSQSLTTAEEISLACFTPNEQSEVTTVEPDQRPESCVEKALNAKQPRLDQLTPGLCWVKPTSNIVERLFSKAKLVVNSQRNSMIPSTLEENLFRFVNKCFWDAVLVNELLK